MDGVSWHGRRDRAWIYGGFRVNVWCGLKSKETYGLRLGVEVGEFPALCLSVVRLAVIPRERAGNALLCEPAEGGTFVGGRVLDLDFKLRKRESTR